MTPITIPAIDIIVVAGEIASISDGKVPSIIGSAVTKIASANEAVVNSDL